MVDVFFIVFMSVAGIVGMLAAFILIFININNKLTRYLGFHLFIVSFEAIYVVSWLNHSILLFPHLYHLDHPLLMLNAATLYFYFREVFTHKKFSIKKEYWHLFPALFLLSFHFPDYAASSQSKHHLIATILKNDYADFHSMNTEEYCIISIAVSSIIYSFYCWRLYKNYLNQEVVNQERLHKFLKWAKVFTKVSLFNLAAFVLAAFIFEINIVSNILIQLVLGFHILTISITLFTNPNILYGINESINLLDVMELDKTRNKILLKSEQKSSYLLVLENYLAMDPYLKCSYSQKLMSTETKIPLHHLSYLINNHYRMNYNEFVNKLRVEYVIKKAGDGEWVNYSIEGIAHEVGFKSKTTFISSFKKITGTTPSNYLFNNRVE